MSLLSKDLAFNLSNQYLMVLKGTEGLEMNSMKLTKGAHHLRKPSGWKFSA